MVFRSLVLDEAALMDAFCLHKPAFDCAYAAGSLCVLMATDPNSHSSKKNGRWLMAGMTGDFLLVVKSCKKVIEKTLYTAPSCDASSLKKKRVTLWLGQENLFGSF